MNRKQVTAILMTIFLICSFVGCNSKKDSGESKSKDITIACDYSTAPLVDDLVKDYNLNNKTSFKIEYMPALEGISKLKSKGCDLVIAHEGIKEEKIKNDTIAADGIVVIVNKGNSIEGISMEQLKDVYTGKVTLWKVLNSNQQGIEAIAYESTVDLQKNFEKKILSSPVIEQMSNNVITVRDVNNAKERVTNSVNSISFITGMCASENVKILKLNGAVLTPESIKNNLYPLKSNICAYYSSKSETTSKFLQYIKSDDGKKIVKKYCSEAS